MTYCFKNSLWTELNTPGSNSNQMKFSITKDEEIGKGGVSSHYLERMLSKEI